MAGAPVGPEFSGEVPSFAGDVHVQGVEGSSPDTQGFTQHVTDVPHQLNDSRGPQIHRQPARVDPCPPECFVGVDIADTGNETLIEQCAFDFSAPQPQPLRHGFLIHMGIQRVTGDMCHRYGNSGQVAALPCRVPITGGHHPGNHEMTEGALIDKGHPPPVVETKLHPQVSVAGPVGVMDEELPTHAEVDHQRPGVVEQQPQVLAPAYRGLHLPAAELLGEVMRAGFVTAYRSGVVHLHAGDGAVQHVGGKAGADRFNFG